MAWKLMEAAWRISSISLVSSALFLSNSMILFISKLKLQRESLERTTSKVESRQFPQRVDLEPAYLKLYCIQQIMNQGFQIRLPIYLLITATTVLGMLLFMNWTADGGIAPLVRHFYYQQQIKTFSQELKIVITTAYYFAVLVIVIYGVGWLWQLWSKKDEDDVSVPQFTQTTNEALVVGFHTFIIFEAFFYYLLNNDGDDLSKKYINLLPFWFLGSWLVYIVGAWLSHWAQLKLYISGILMVSILWVLILGEIYSNGFITTILNL